MSDKRYNRYTVHRSKRVAEFWAKTSKGTYLGYKDGTSSFEIQRAGKSVSGNDKGAYVVGYDDDNEFVIRKLDHDYNTPTI